MPDPANASGSRVVLVIVNADDLGMSTEVNEAIFDLMARGRLTSATLLANAPATEQAISPISRFPQCSFGVHLNVVEYKPLSRSKGISELVDSEGNLQRLPMGFKFSPAILQGIYTEFSAQIEKLRARGVPISHLDSHMHVHLNPPLFPVVKALQMKYGIRKLRMRHYLPLPGEQLPLERTLKLALQNWALRHVGSGVTTDAGAELSKFVIAGPGLPPSVRTVETLTHPGNPHYSGDIALALSPWESALPYRVRLISFNELGRSTSVD